MQRRREKRWPLRLALSLSIALHVAVFAVGFSLNGHAARVDFVRGRSGLVVRVIPSVASRAAPVSAPTPRPVEVQRRELTRRPSHPSPKGNAPAPLHTDLRRPPAEAAPPRPAQPVSRERRVEPRPDDARAPVDAAETAGDLREKGVQRARLTGFARPQYPPVSRRLEEEGRAVLEVRVGADGSVVSVRVVESSGYWRLDNAALRAVRIARFTPARRFGRPVASVLRLAFTFRLETGPAVRAEP